MYLSVFNSISLRVPLEKHQRAHNLHNCCYRSLWMYQNLVTEVWGDKAARNSKPSSTLQSQGRRWARSVNCLTSQAAREPLSPAANGASNALFLFHKGGHKQGLQPLGFPLIPLLLDAVLFLHWVFSVSLLLVPVSAHSSVVLWQLRTPIKIKR